MIQALRILRDRSDIAALVVLLLGVQLLPRSVPAGVYGLGVVAGCGVALHAIGVVLVYRSDRVINFAQVAVGSAAAAIFVALVQFQPLIRGLNAVCPVCIDRPTATALRVNYWISLGLTFALAALLSFVMYRFVIRRFERAPRLIATVATIFCAQLLASIQTGAPGLMVPEEEQDFDLVLRPVGPPFELSWRVGDAAFDAPDLIVVAAAVLAAAGVLLWLRRSATGIAIRASASNPSRVETLGVDIHRVRARVWVMAGLLSTVAGMSTVMAVGSPTQPQLSVSLLVKILAAAVIARMAGLGTAVAAAIALGITEQGFLWAFGSTVAFEGLLLVVIAAVLLLQTQRTSRAELEQLGAWKAEREIRPTPSQLRHLSGVRSWRRAGVVLLAVLLLGAPWALSPAQTTLAAVALTYAMVGLSLLVLTGWAGQISLGQFAFAAVGAYVLAVVNLPLLGGLVLAAAAGAVVALVVGLPALKLRGLHLAITTLAFSLSATAILLNPSYLGRHLPTTLDRPLFLGMDFADQRVFYYGVLVVVALTTVAVLGMRRSRTARALISARDNEAASQSFGIPLVRTRLGAFAVSGAIAAVAGALFAFATNGVETQAFAPEQSVLMFLMAVIGGFGSVAGPLLGAAYVGALTVFSASPGVTFLATGGGGLAVLVVLPGGLAQGVFDLRDAVLRRVAARHRIVVPALVADVRTEGAERRVPIAPKVRATGGSAFVPTRYGLEGQWGLGLDEDTVLAANVAADKGGTDD